EEVLGRHCSSPYEEEVRPSADPGDRRGTTPCSATRKMGGIRQYTAQCMIGDYCWVPVMVCVSVQTTAFVVTLVSTAVNLKVWVAPLPPARQPNLYSRWSFTWRLPAARARGKTAPSVLPCAT